MKKPKIAVVLVGAMGDANIGAVARAMKNFGLCDLRLVECCEHLTKAAYMYAVDARDVLEAARLFPTLNEALAESSTAVAFTRRIGKMRRCRMAVAKLPAWVAGRGGAGKTALVFGREDQGLTNEEVRMCDAIVRIPSSAALPSLNLAQSVLVAAYELFTNAPGSSRAGKRPASSGEERFVQRREIMRLLRNMNKTLEALGYDDGPPHELRTRILHQLERIFGRAGLTPRDAGMFEGLSARIRTAAGKKPPPPKRRGQA